MHLLRASLRYLAVHPAQSVLGVLGVALGVAIVVGIQITQESSKRAFDASMRSVFGANTHHVIAAEEYFDEGVLGDIRRLAPSLHPTPVLEGTLQIDVESRPRMRLLGVDPIGQASAAVGDELDLMRFISVPGGAIIGAGAARRWQVTAGDRLAVRTRAGPAELEIIAVAGGRRQGSFAVADNVIVVDIASAQEILDLAGRLSRIELDGAADAGQLMALEGRLPGLLRVVETGRYTHSARQLTRAFYINLNALSLLALLVGIFLIFNTTAFLVVQRRAVFARLRAIGVTRGGIATLVLVEALMLGAVGGVCGVILGTVLANVLMGSIAQTMSDHYFEAASVAALPSPLLTIAGVGLALAATLVAALLPALEASRVEPCEALRPTAFEHALMRKLRWVAGAAVVLVTAGVILLAYPSQSLLTGFAGLGCFILAATLATPWLAYRVIQRVLGSLHARLAVPERNALAQACRSMSRIGIAMAALMAATATSVGIGVMVTSFRLAVIDWLDTLLRAEIYVSEPGRRDSGPLIGPGLRAQIVALPTVAELSTVRRLSITREDGDVRVTAYHLPAAARDGFRFLSGSARNVWRTWTTADTVIVSEPFAYRHRTGVGDDLVLPTPAGPVAFEIVGVYQDYTNERGVVAMSSDNFVKYWRDRRVHGIGVYPAQDANSDALAQELTAVIAPYQLLSMWSNAEVKRRSLEIFDRTFDVTEVLSVLAALIAALGVFSALLALHLERMREYAVMRALGCSNVFVRRTLYAQTFVVGAIAGLFAIPIGIGIAAILIEVINVRSFGWSMHMYLTPAAVAIPPVLAVTAALAATVYPAERAVRVQPAAALRYE